MNSLEELAGPDPIEREERRNLALFAMLCFSLLLGLVLMVALSEEETKQGPPPKLSVVNAYAYKVAETDEGYDFQLVILLTNHEQTPAENIKIQVASLDPNTEITYDKSNISGFSIPLENSTEPSIERKVSFSVDAKVSRYRMEVVVFLDDVWLIKGELVTAPQGAYGVSEWRVTQTRGQTILSNTQNDGSSTNAALAFFFGLLLVTQLVVSLFYIRLKPLKSGLRKILPLPGKNTDAEQGREPES